MYYFYQEWLLSWHYLLYLWTLGQIYQRFVEARCEILTQPFLHFRFTMLQPWIGSSSAVSSTVLPQFWSLLEFTTLLRLVVGRGLVVRLRVEWMNLIPSLMKIMRMTMMGMMSGKMWRSGSMWTATIGWWPASRGTWWQSMTSWMMTSMTVLTDRGLLVETSWTIWVQWLTHSTTIVFQCTIRGIYS